MVARDFEPADVVFGQNSFEHGGIGQGHAPCHCVAATTLPTKVQLGCLCRPT